MRFPDKWYTMRFERVFKRLQHAYRMLKVKIVSGYWAAEPLNSGPALNVVSLIPRVQLASFRTHRVLRYNVNQSRGRDFC